jgi:DNA-binding NarL/FixJ family response regulator
LRQNDLHDNHAPAIAALVADLMFASRVRGAAPGARTVHSADALQAVIGPATRLILVDLHARGAIDAIAAVRENGTTAAIVAFGSHVETDALQAARAAGADRVLARSAFVRELPDLVRQAEGE